MLSELRQLINKTDTNSLSGILNILKTVETMPGVSGMPSLKIKILRNYTAEYLEPYLRWHLICRGIKSNIDFGSFATAMQEAIDLSPGEVDLIIISVNLDEFEPDWKLNTFNPELTVSRLLNLFATASQKSGAFIIVNTFIMPLQDPYGVASVISQHSLTNKVSQLNSFIIDWVRENSDKAAVVDWNLLVSRIGVDSALDMRMAYLARSPFKQGFLNNYASQIARISQSFKGKTKKCIVLDCDNTLWGGIIGEDGIDGIKLDPYDYPGRCFRDFQQMLLALQKRGVLLTLCSKNNEVDVLSVIESHPHCLIRPEHLAAYRINWQDKPSNICALANELNLGMDAFVFIDDSDVECHLVTNALPEIEVLKVPKNLVELPHIAIKDGFFDTLSVSHEDSLRTTMYQNEAKRKKHALSFLNIGEYLSSLEIKIIIKDDSLSDITRIAQLTQKTNQFNLTHRRYAEKDIQSFINSREQKVFTLYVSDIFGDSGLTGVLIAKNEKSRVCIDTLLLSCRILGREIEKEFVSRCLEVLQNLWNPSFWAAYYIPSEKNSQTADFWLNFGLFPKKATQMVTFTGSNEDLKFYNISHITTTISDICQK